jgi:hypothetical protein
MCYRKLMKKRCLTMAIRKDTDSFLIFVQRLTLLKTNQCQLWPGRNGRLRNLDNKRKEKKRRNKSSYSSTRLSIVWRLIIKIATNTTFNFYKRIRNSYTNFSMKTVISKLLKEQSNTWLLERIKESLKVIIDWSVIKVNWELLLST